MINKELELAWEFVNHTQKSIFLTGKAGTGKTTFLHRLKKECNKRLAIVAPTGVAAINARGVTIHSLFQIPFGPLPPDTVFKRDFRQKFSQKKINLIKSLDLLIIDEISMVRADLLDAIDQTLRRYRNRQKVFGGIQVLMIGDLQQLAPVVKSHDWALLKTYYETPYFFSSKAFQEIQSVSIELKNIFRQKDATFIQILNEIRENKLSSHTAELLNKRYIVGFTPKLDDDYIILTTHNYKAEKINKQKLSELKGRTFYYHAHIEGHFPENTYPNDLKLALKKGAQVMFIKNDSSPDKRYFNGKIGRISFIDDKNIYVTCPGETQEIEVKRERWENVTYELDQETGQITEKLQGSYSQIPLRLAWAITIHKSQGLTFDKAIIDAELSFAHGQTYVALSRCKTLDGLILQSPIKPHSIINDSRVSRFTQHIAENAPDKSDLTSAKKQFFINSISELLDYTPLLYNVNRLLHLLKTHKGSIQGSTKVALDELKIMLTDLSDISFKFTNQINQLATDTKDIQNNQTIQERLNKAFSYYRDLTKEKIEPVFKKIKFDIEHKQIKKDFEKHYLELANDLNQKIYILDHLELPYEISKYLNIRAQAIVKSNLSKPKKINQALPEIIHEDLFDALKTLRNNLAIKENVPHYQIFTQETLYHLCEKLPVTDKQLKEIKGIGKSRFNKYGTQILTLIQDYCLVNNIEWKADQPKKQIAKTNTRQISLQLYQTGKNIEEIAEYRTLTTGTIWNHLASFLPTGEIKITDLIPAKKIKNIRHLITTHQFKNLTELKKIAGNAYSWDELRLIMKELENEI